MSYPTWKMRGLSAAFVVVGTLGWVSSAEAIVSRKVWDPAYGAALPELGWSGSVDFNIADSCLNTITSSQWISNLAFGSCQNKLSIDSAVVTLYDLNAPGSSVQLSYDGGSSLFSGDNVNVALRMYVEVVSATEKTLTAVQGGFLFPEFSNASFAKVTGYDAAAYWLNFNANTTNNFSLTTSNAPQGDYAFLTSCSFDYAHAPGAGEKYDTYKTKYTDVSCSQNDGVSNPAILRPVPEPSSYLLGLASFGVLGLWAHRRSRAPIAS